MVCQSWRVAVWLALGLLVLTLAGKEAKKALAAAMPADQAAAVRAVEQLGGRVKVDETRPGKPVVAVHLSGTRVTDAGLVHLKGLKSLQRLGLDNTRVTDAGVKQLQLARPGLTISR